MNENRRITKRMVDVRELPKGSPSFLWDSELRGFGVKFNPSGSRVFILQYRNRERRMRRIEIGRYGVVTLEQARDAARIKLGEVAKGIDPAAEKREARNGLSVGSMCDWYLAESEAGRLLGRKRQPIKTSTLYMDRSRIETHIRPLLGRRKVAALALTDIEQMQTDIAAGKTAKPKGDGRGRKTTGGKGAAARSVTTLHCIFGHAKRHGLIDINPALGVRKYPDQRKTRRLSRQEIGDLGQVLRDVADTEHPVGLAVVRLLVLSGLRLNEAQGLKREWVSAEGFIAYPDTKGGAQVRVIGRAALDVIRSQPALSDSPNVFPSDGGQSHFIAADGVLGRICRRLGFNDVTAHTLRHTFASMAGELGYSELTIAAMLGHAAGTVTGRYVHIDEAIKAAAERVSAEIVALIDAKVPEQAQTAAAVFSFSGSFLGSSSSPAPSGLVTIRAASR